MKIKIKTEKELKKMFMQEEHEDADNCPAAFFEYVEYIPKEMFGKTFLVADASKSLFSNEVPFIYAFPAYFVVSDGQNFWNISSRFIRGFQL